MTDKEREVPRTRKSISAENAAKTAAWGLRVAAEREVLEAAKTWMEAYRECEGREGDHTPANFLKFLGDQRRAAEKVMKEACEKLWPRENS